MKIELKQKKGKMGKSVYISKFTKVLILMKMEKEKEKEKEKEVEGLRSATATPSLH